VGGASESLKRASRNLPNLTVMPAQQVNTYQVVAHKRIVFTESGLKQLAAVAGVV
jgi:ribosomal protein L4